MNIPDFILRNYQIILKDLGYIIIDIVKRFIIIKDI